MNWIFLGIILSAFLAAALGEFTHVSTEGVPSPMEALSAGVFSSATGAVELALSLIHI